ncbi:MAG TPA: twin-arginine translocase TatA/TatE family subunit [Phycisphaerae bacterium]|nr:twin-arginine translocase TatA/TatE family subunit [Phycisphaerae bacterium]
MGPTDGFVAFISMPGGGEMIILGIIGLLIFGNRLPEVAKSLGKSVVEFKRGLSGVQDEIERSINTSQQTDVLPPPSAPSSSVPATTDSSVETATSSAESPVATAESPVATAESPTSPTEPSPSSAESSTPETNPDATPPPDQTSEPAAESLSRRLGPNGEWITDPG